MERITKVQELVYELQVKDVMREDVITVTPDMLMSDLREIFRSNRISGTPVVNKNKLVGIISIEDFIKWLADSGKDCRISEKMTGNVEVSYEDDPLIQAINRLEKYGRFPVMDRKTNKLVGIITKGSIIEGLLKKMEIEYHEEELRRYRASHIFEDIIADNSTLIFNYYIVNRDLGKAGGSASGLKTTLKRMGFHPDVVRRSGIAAYEAETNVIIYAGGGQITARVVPTQIYIKVEDKGPGIPDIEKAMMPGYSTAPEWVREMGFGAGMGLSNIKKCSDKMVLNSAVGKGTCLEIVINIKEGDNEVKRDSECAKPAN